MLRCVCCAKTQRQRFHAVWVSTTNGGGTITEYASPSFTTSTTINDPHQPFGLAFDGSQDLWVVNDTTNAVAEYAPPYTGAPTTFPVVTGPIGMAFDFSGNLWVAGTGSIDEYSPPTIASATTIADANTPFFLAFTP
jgi:sugar lactone lactonase YvrE